MFIGYQSYSLCHSGLLKECFSLGFEREREREREKERENERERHALVV